MKRLISLTTMQFIVRRKMSMKLHYAVMMAEYARRLQNSTNTKQTNHVDYFRQVKAHLREDRQREALQLLQEALMLFPNEPTLMSYYGYLSVIVDRKCRIRIETCQKAIEQLSQTGTQGESTSYPIFYYNLGKAYSAAGKRQESLDALHKGLSYDPRSSDIKKELQKIGVRREKPPIPFLDRSNPLNKYLGIALYKRKKKA